MKLAALTLLGVVLGLLTSVLAAFIFLIWFDAYWRRHEIEAHLSGIGYTCDPEALSPIWDENWIDELEARLTK